MPGDKRENKSKMEQSRKEYQNTKTTYLEQEDRYKIQENLAALQYKGQDVSFYEL